MGFQDPALTRWATEMSPLRGLATRQLGNLATRPRTRTQIISNTTGSTALAEQNAAALMMAKFYPIVQKGQKKDFLYYYRVDY